MGEHFGILCAAPNIAGPARVAAALTRHGAEVCIVAPPDSYAALTRYKRADMLMPFEEIQRKLPVILHKLAEDFGAHSVLAGDDGAFGALALLVQRVDTLKLSEATRAMLARSMPAAPQAAQLACDSAFIIAQPDGLCAPPRSIANASQDEAARFAAEIGFPILLKRDAHAGGMGITRCENQAELRTAVANTTPGFVLQQFARGKVCGVAVSGIAGKSASAFSFVKHVTIGAAGVPSVLKYEWRDDIIAHASALYENYGLNGYVGVDYIVDEAGRAHLLEINKSIVAKSHFAGCFGVDLTAATLALLRGQPVPAPTPPSHEFVALFPNEWARDPASPYLQSALHDVPWDDPDVLAAMIASVHREARTRARDVVHSPA